MYQQIEVPATDNKQTLS